MCENEALHSGFQRDLCSFTCGRMSGLDSTWLFIVGKSRFVDQSIRTFRHDHSCFGWTRITREYDAPSRARRTYELRGRNHTAIVEGDAFALVNLSPRGSFRNPEISCLVGIESSKPDIFNYCVAQRDLVLVIDIVWNDRISLSGDWRIGSHLIYLERKRLPVGTERNRSLEQCCRIARTPQTHRLRPALE